MFDTIRECIEDDREFSIMFNGEYIRVYPQIVEEESDIFVEVEGIQYIIDEYDDMEDLLDKIKDLIL